MKLGEKGNGEKRQKKEERNKKIKINNCCKQFSDK